MIGQVPVGSVALVEQVPASLLSLATPDMLFRNDARATDRRLNAEGVDDRRPADEFCPFRDQLA